MPPLGFSPELDERTTSRQFFVSCTGFLSRDGSTSSWHVLFTRLCPARHLRTWLTTYTWFLQVQDVDSDRPPTDRTLFHAHTTHFDDRSFAADGPSVWNSLPVHLRDEDITHNSNCFRHELKMYSGFNVAFGAQCDNLFNCSI